MRSSYFYSLVGGFFLGVLFRSFFNFGATFSLLLLLIVAVIFALYQFGNFKNTPNQPVLILLVIFIFACALGIFRFETNELKKDLILFNSIGRVLKFEGVVINEPDERENGVHLTVRLEKIFDKDISSPVFGTTLVFTDFYPKFNYGDRVTLYGQLLFPKNFENTDGPDFDYVAYLAKEGITYQMIRPKLILIAKNQGNFIVAKLFDIKHGFITSLKTMIPEPNVSLLGGLLLGTKHSLSKALLEDFRVAGVIHIVVLSGYNITIVAEAVMKFLSFLPRVWGLSFGAVAILLFSIMTGGGATVVRSAVMALLVMLAQVVHRKYDITRALLVAGFLMVFQNPKILVFDSSFQLSFMATIALIYVSPKVEPYLSFLPEKFGFRTIVTATLATQIFLFPILLYKMGMLSVVALPVNLLILPFIPFTMLFGFIAGAVYFINSFLALPFAFVSYGVLEYFIQIVTFAADLPFASLTINKIPIALPILIYAVYIFIYFRYRPKEN